MRYIMQRHCRRRTESLAIVAVAAVFGTRCGASAEVVNDNMMIAMGQRIDRIMVAAADTVSRSTPSSHTMVIALTIGVLVALVLLVIAFACGFYVGASTRGGVQTTILTGARGDVMPLRVRQNDPSPSRKEIAAVQQYQNAVSNDDVFPLRSASAGLGERTTRRQQRPPLDAELNFYDVSEPRKGGGKLNE